MKNLKISIATDQALSAYFENDTLGQRYFLSDEPIFSAVAFRNSRELSLLRYTPEKLYATLTTSAKSLFLVAQRCWTLFIPSFNLAFWSMLNPSSQLLTLLPCSLQQFVEYAGIISSSIKTGDITPNGFRDCEGKAIIGYQVQPVPGFDILDDAKRFAQSNPLAHGGPLASEWLPAFKTQVESIITPREATIVPFPKLEDYLNFGDWQVSGSAGIKDHLDYEFEGKSFAGRVTKNLVLDVLSIPDLLTLVLNREQTSNAFIKEEFKRPRLVVGSDLGTNIKMGYITQWFLPYMLRSKNISYKDTPKYFKEQVLKQVRTGWIEGMLACSFDFKTFEVQPSHEEITIIFIVICTPYLEATGDPLGLIDLILSGWDDHQIWVWIKGILHRIRQTNGLPSGIRWTTFVGSIWNQSSWLTVFKLAGISPPPILFYKGDDTILQGPPAELICQVAAGISSGFLASTDQFALNGISSTGGIVPQGNRCEFLRRMITPDEVIGYPLRSMVHVAQIKPWSTAVDPTYGKAAGLLSTITTLSCRLLIPIDTLTNIVASLLYPLRALRLPTLYGGAGFMVSNAITLPKERSLGYDRPKVNITCTPERRRYLIEKYQLPTDMQFDFDKWASFIATDKISADDASPIRSTYRRTVRKHIDNIALQTYPIHAQPTPFNDTKPRFFDHQHGNKVLLYVEQWRYLSDLDKARFNNFSNFLQQQDLLVSSTLRATERYLQCRRSEAIDWLQGNVPYSPNLLIHPNLIGMAKHSLAYACRYILRNRRLNSAAKFIRVSEHALDLQQRLSGPNTPPDMRW
jgi:hypothetical protein